MPTHDPDNDGQLFRAAIGADRGEVRVLPATAPPPDPPKPHPAARMAERDARVAQAELAQLDAATVRSAEARTWVRPGIPARIRAQLAQGEFAVQRELDLGGRPHAAALSRLAAFLRVCRHDGLGCVRIVHRCARMAPTAGRAGACAIEAALEHRAAVLAVHATVAADLHVLTVLLARR